MSTLTFSVAHRVRQTATARCFPLSSMLANLMTMASMRRVSPSYDIKKVQCASMLQYSTCSLPCFSELLLPSSRHLCWALVPRPSLTLKLSRETLLFMILQCARMRAERIGCLVGVIFTEIQYLDTESQHLRRYRDWYRDTYFARPRNMDAGWCSLA